MEKVFFTLNKITCKLKNSTSLTTLHQSRQIERLSRSFNSFCQPHFSSVNVGSPEFFHFESPGEHISKNNLRQFKDSYTSLVETYDTICVGSGDLDPIQFVFQLKGANIFAMTNNTHTAADTLRYHIMQCLQTGRLLLKRFHS